MYDRYLMALNDQIPALRQGAFQEWLAEGDQLQRQFENAGRLENFDYSRYRDMVSDWEDDRGTQLSSAGAQTDDYYKYLNAQLNLTDRETDNYWKQRSQD